MRLALMPCPLAGFPQAATEVTQYIGQLCLRAGCASLVNTNTGPCEMLVQHILSQHPSIQTRYLFQPQNGCSDLIFC